MIIFKWDSAALLTCDHCSKGYTVYRAFLFSIMLNVLG